VAGGQIEEPFCFFNGLAGLHGHGGVDGALAHHCLQIGDEEVAAKG
jgi:hypothetical protein